MITPQILISNGAGCFGCRDATPKIDLSKIPAQPVAGQCYPYTVACPACQLVTGQVCFEDCDDGNACTIDTCDPVTGCIYTPIVCDDENTCTTDTCDPDKGCVFTSLSCDSVSPPLGFSLPEFLCPASIPTNEQLISLAGLECTCDEEPVITVPLHELGTVDGITTWEYTALCGSPECSTPVVGQFDNADCLPPCSCEPKAPNLCGCKGYPFPYALFERLGGGCKPLPGCDQTPV